MIGTLGLAKQALSDSGLRLLLVWGAGLECLGTGVFFFGWDFKGDSFWSGGLHIRPRSSLTSASSSEVGISSTGWAVGVAGRPEKTDLLADVGAL